MADPREPFRSLTAESTPDGNLFGFVDNQIETSPALASLITGLYCRLKRILAVTGISSPGPSQI